MAHSMSHHRRHSQDTPADRSTAMILFVAVTALLALFALAIALEPLAERLLQPSPASACAVRAASSTARRRRRSASGASTVTSGRYDRMSFSSSRSSA